VPPRLARAASAAPDPPAEVAHPPCRTRPCLIHPVWGAGPQDRRSFLRCCSTPCASPAGDSPLEIGATHPLSERFAAASAASQPAAQTRPLLLRSCGLRRRAYGIRNRQASRFDMHMYGGTVVTAVGSRRGGRGGGPRRVVTQWSTRPPPCRRSNTRHHGSWAHGVRADPVLCLIWLRGEFGC
jgi:hypothetical protein